jgi:hypothetical protein
LTAADVQAVYDAIVEYVVGRPRTHIKSKYLDVDKRDDAIGRAIGELVDTEDCPLDISTWSEPNGGRSNTWRVERRVATDGGQTTVCPDCDSAGIQRWGSDHTDGGRVYYCHDCDARFDDPATRAREHPPGIPKGTMARTLSETDSDDLVTDGGLTYLSPQRAVIQALDAHGDEAPVGGLLDALLQESAFGVGALCEAIHELHASGEIYQPEPDSAVVRFTDRDGGDA